MGALHWEVLLQVHLFIYFDSFPLLCALNENSFPFDVDVAVVVLLVAVVVVTLFAAHLFFCFSIHTTLTKGDRHMCHRSS